MVPRFARQFANLFICWRLILVILVTLGVGVMLILSSTFLSVTSAQFLGQGVDLVVEESSPQQFRITFGLMAGLLVAWILTDVVGRRFVEKAFWLYGNFQCKARMSSIASADHRFGEALGPASLYSSVDEDEVYLIKAINIVLPALVSLMGLLIFGFITISSSALPVAFLYSCGIGFALVSIAWSAPRAIRAGRRLRDSESELGQIEREWFLIGPEVAGGVGEKILRKRRTSCTYQAVRRARESAGSAMTLLMTCNTIIAITEAAAVVVSLYYVLWHSAPIGLAAMTWQCAQMTREPLNQLMWGLPELSKGMGALQRIRTLESRAKAFQVKYGKRSPEARAGLIVDGVCLWSKLEVGDVPSPSSPKLGPFSFSVEPGEVVGISGNSGIGKSSLMNAIAGLRQADVGKICVGGYQRRQVHRDWWMHQVVGISQRAVLDQSAPLYSVDLEELVKRKLAKNPLVLLLDEPTAKLKSSEARRFMIKLRQEVSDSRTAVVVVSHSSETLDMCDRIVTIGP